jgi:hypothetical protein
MPRRLLLLILLIFSCFTLAACASREQDTGRHVPEVLLGTDCGFDRMKCCTSTPICTYGQQCCANPNNASQNYCADNCHCGANEEFCCAGNVCNGGATCVKGICAACGGKGEACCSSGDSCSSGLVCQDNRCAECGHPGELCCLGKEACLAKAGGRAECLDNICADCGFDGNPACTAGDECLANNILAGKTCERCGQSNQPCCPVSSTVGYACDPAAGLKCDLGFCSSEH